MLLHAIEEVVHVSFVRQTEAPALAPHVLQIEENMHTQSAQLQPESSASVALLHKGVACLSYTAALTAIGDASNAAGAMVRVACRLA